MGARRLASERFCGAGVVVLILFGQGSGRDGFSLYLHLEGRHPFSPREEGEGVGGDLQFAVDLASCLGPGLAPAVEVPVWARARGKA